MSKKGEKKGQPPCQILPQASPKMLHSYCPSKSLLKTHPLAKSFTHSSSNGYNKNKAGIMKNTGEGNGNPLQYGGAWWAAVHGVANSRIWLSDFTFAFHFHALEKEMATHSSALAWRIPGTGEPGGLPSMGSHRAGHDWSNLAAAAAWRTWTEVFTIPSSKIKYDFIWSLDFPEQSIFKLQGKLYIALILDSSILWLFL